MPSSITPRRAALTGVPPPDPSVQVCLTYGMTIATLPPSSDRERSLTRSVVDDLRLRPERIHQDLRPHLSVNVQVDLHRTREPPVGQGDNSLRTLLPDHRERRRPHDRSLSELRNIDVSDVSQVELDVR